VTGHRQEVIMMTGGGGDDPIGEGVRSEHAEHRSGYGSKSPTHAYNRAEGVTSRKTLTGGVCSTQQSG
jgi:hypothetical protein